MNKFENLVNALIEENNKRKNEQIDRINSASAENYDSLEASSTERRWEQFVDGEITEEQAKRYAIKRTEQKYDKDLAKELERVRHIGEAKDISYIDIAIEYTKNQAKATVRTNNGFSTGVAGGYGYDRASGTSGEALNKRDDILNILYQYKDDKMASGETGNSHTLIEYGAGYGVLPYFEGGVGVSCFERIIKLLGFEETTCFCGESFDYYHFEKKAENRVA